MRDNKEEGQLLYVDFGRKVRENQQQRAEPRYGELPACAEKPQFPAPMAGSVDFSDDS